VVASLRLATGLRSAVLLAMGIGVTSSLLGLTIAFYGNMAAGGAVVLTSVGLLVLVETGATLRNRMQRGRRQGNRFGT